MSKVVFPLMEEVDGKAVIKHIIVEPKKVHISTPKDFESGKLEILLKGKVDKVLSPNNDSERIHTIWAGSVSPNSEVSPYEMLLNVHTRNPSSGSPLVLQYQFPEFNDNDRLVGLYTKVIDCLRGLGDKDLIIKLSDFIYDPAVLLNYIELVENLPSKMDEKTRVSILEKTRHYRGILDIVKFFKDLQVQSIKNATLEQIQQSMSTLSEIPNADLSYMSSYVNSAEDNTKRWEPIDRAMVLTFPDERGKFLCRKRS